MKQQTAVEWLLNVIETKNGKEFSSYYTEFIEQAKEMEKEQIVNSWDLSRRDIDYPANGEQYYNTTFKNK